MISTVCLLAVLAIAAPPEIRLEAKPSTRIFIRTVPVGAKIVLDGKTLGQTDALLVVPPGVRKITLELDGYHPEVREVDAADGWITRVECQLRKQRPDAQPDPPVSDANSPPTAVVANPADAPPSAGEATDQGSVAALQFLAQADMSADTKQAMQTVLKQHPTELRWSGRSGDRLFAVAAKRLPDGDIRTRSVPAMLELVHMQVVQELLTAKSLLDQFEAAGLNDATTLRAAVEEAAGNLHVTGDVQGVIHQAAKVDDFAVGYVIADESGLSGYLLQPAELEIVRTAYRDVMHRQARDLMDRGDWQNALLLWQHLHKRQLVSQQLYLDAARCFKALKQPDDTVSILKEAIIAFDTSGSPEFFEEAGDLLLDIETEDGQTLAETAYTKASDALKQTISAAVDPELYRSRSK